MSNELTMVAYTGLDEVLVCSLTEEHRMLAEYFNDPEDRNIDDYDRETCSYVVEMRTRIRTDVTN